MNIQEADKNPADKEAEKKGKCQLMGLKRRRKRIKGIIGRTHGQGIPWGGAGGVFISKGHGSVAGQGPDLLNPNLSVGRGLSLLLESEGGMKLRRLRSRCQTTLLPAVGASLEMK